MIASLYPHPRLSNTFVSLFRQNTPSGEWLVGYMISQMLPYNPAIRELVVDIELDSSKAAPTLPSSAIEAERSQLDPSKWVALPKEEVSRLA